MKYYIILGHGSRNPESNQSIKSIAEMFQNDRDEPVKHAFFQLAEPSLTKVIKDIVNKGGKTITIVPVFLFNGVHIKQDIPEVISEQQKKYPDISFELSEPIGDDPQLVDILHKRANSAQKFD